MPKHTYLLIALLLAIAPRPVSAVSDITSMTTNFVPGTASSAEGYTYQNGQLQLTGFSTGASTYSVVGLANNVFVRRNGVDANQSSVWYTSAGAGLAGVHQGDYGSLLLSNNLYGGSDNTFANNGGVSSGNIERIDFTWNSPITVTNSFAFAVFDRGAVGVHDSFAIAAITAIDASGNPTAFGTLLRVATGWGGATNPMADQDYRLFRYNNGDVIGAATASSETGTQGIGGVVVTAADLGLALGMNIYGYALMAIDVTATNSTQLLDWTNSTYYPTNTDGTTGGGGIDLAAVNGILYSTVPEPGTWVLLVLGGCLAAGAGRRGKQRHVRTS